MNIENLQGSIVALVTPFTENGEIDFNSFDNLIEWHIAEGTNGIVVCGTTGETPTLSEDEDASLMERAVKVSNGRIPIIAGTGSNSTKDCIAYSKRAESLGVDGLLVVAPYYNKPTPAGLKLHFSMLAAEVNIPIILYNVPSRTGCDITPNIAIELANEHKNIVGIKEAAGKIEYFTELISKRKEGFKIYSGDDYLSPIANLLGADGCISVIANVIPADFSKLMKYSIEGNTKETNNLFYKYIELMDLMFIESNPIPVKAALAKMNKIEEKYRAPMCQMEMANKEQLISEMKKLNII